MKIEHIALWTSNLEKMKDFYVTYFGAIANDVYENKTKGFSSQTVEKRKFSKVK
ncbi:VOC family protein, partial [Listeria ivanovii]